MNAKNAIKTLVDPDNRQARASHHHVGRLLPLVMLLVLARPVAVHAQFHYTTNTGVITITGYTGPGGSITIPETIDGLPVTGVGWQAFSWRSDLINVAIPRSVTWIADAAFYNCASLASMMIPDSVTWIGKQTFGACSSLGEIGVDPLNPSYSSLDGVLFNRSQTTLIQYPGGQAGHYSVPNTVTVIGSDAFASCSSLTGITIPGSVTSIGSGAFVSCTSLGSVTIPNSVADIGSGAFNQCSNLTTATIGNSITKIPDNTFIDCNNLTGVYFCGNCPVAGMHIFQGAENATVYRLPGTIGWGPTFADRPTAIWLLPYPVILTSGPSFGVTTNRFGFIISWATNLSVVVSACDDVANPTWFSVSTNTLIDGSTYFTDPDWTNYAARFYRVRSP